MDKIESGSLLVSMPFLGDPNFERSVILICEHNDDGSFGLILNQKSSFNLSDFELFEDDLYDDKVFQGGPVQNNTIHFIHGYDTLENSVQVRDHIYWGGDFENLKARVENNEVETTNIRFYLGYSGWSEGQLQEEIDRKSWAVFNGYSKNLFRIEHEQLWKEILIEMGGEYARFANFPIDPGLN